jgi:hypothetical protein
LDSITTVSQHVGIVVRLDEQRVTAREGVDEPAGHVAEVGGMAEARPRPRDHEGQGTGRVVGNRHPGHGQGADLLGLAGAEHVVARDVTGPEPGRGVRPPASAQPHSPLPGKGCGPAGVIAVLVGDEHRGERAGIDPGRDQPFGQDAGAEAGVHQQTRPSGLDQCRVPGAPRPQNAETQAHAA